MITLIHQISSYCPHDIHTYACQNLNLLLLRHSLYISYASNSIVYIPPFQPPLPNVTT